MQGQGFESSVYGLMYPTLTVLQSTKHFERASESNVGNSVVNMFMIHVISTYCLNSRFHMIIRSCTFPMSLKLLLSNH